MADANVAAADAACNPVLSADTNDAELLQLDAQLAHVWRVADHLFASAAAIADAGAPQAEVSAIDDVASEKAVEAFDLEDRIIATPAHTLAGVVVKLRAGRRNLVRQYSPPGPSDAPLDPAEIPAEGQALLSVLADLERMTAAAG